MSPFSTPVPRRDCVWRMPVERIDPARRDGAFIVMVAAFLAAFFLWYPATYAIDDECNILSLAFSLAHGTAFLDQAGVNLDADLRWHGHLISKFSPFHAALLVPAVATRWRLAFLVSAAFFIWGAFILRGMLRRDGLSSGWTVLYFLNPGLLYYSRTLLAVVPAAVMGLLGASLLFRARPRPTLAAVALGGATLLHIWLAPVAIVLALGWWVEHERLRLRSGAALLVGAAPSVAALALYNFATTGSPLRNAYWLIGHQYAFNFSHVGAFASFYLASLLLIPPAGWAAFMPKHAGSWTIPVTIAAVVALGSAYYYRDGVGQGLAGWVPGQRFLMPASLLACVPAARCLASFGQRMMFSRRMQSCLEATAVAGFAVLWILLSTYHQAHLKAHAELQAAIRTHIPNGAYVVSSGRMFKEYAPVNGSWNLVFENDEGAPNPADRDGAYTVWLGLPGEVPPPEWFRGRVVSVTKVRSWIWNRDLWIAAPVAAANISQ